MFHYYVYTYHVMFFLSIQKSQPSHQATPKPAPEAQPPARVEVTEAPPRLTSPAAAPCQSDQVPPTIHPLNQTRSLLHLLRPLDQRLLQQLLPLNQTRSLLHLLPWPLDHRSLQQLLPLNQTRSLQQLLPLNQAVNYNFLGQANL